MIQHIFHGDVRIAYEESGSGEPLVLLHGGESGRVQYDTFRPVLGDGIRAIAYDQRDTGDSTNPAEPYRVDDLADDCAALIRGLGYERAHIFGASYGGAIALQVAVNRPEVVRTLTAGTAIPRFSAAPASAQNLTHATEDRAAKMLDAVLSGKGQQEPKLLTEARRILLHRPAGADKRRMDAIREFDVLGRLGEITAPTLLIYGGDDPLGRVEYGQRIAEAVPGARLEVLPGMRHGITLEAKHEVAALLRDFILTSSR
ncbi:alpha/beta fold hydrolase [Amycolatopsis sp. CA-230715]|uniref:alpha/beta fold hydrolase n=1 Tax=Amycolatopsis sp. CA-230715 TaxID=2745196 RepID=UPI001C00BE9E|nr:alpha/beta fold hydrolase [Amycolatopsis sp. CA-230715]QWF82498.1 2-hydroxy-6-oxo-6-phenylhexa-2,4-dienoate hydrolase [Amycolatopsis sp. CA-230715]